MIPFCGIFVFSLCVVLFNKYLHIHKAQTFLFVCPGGRRSPSSSWRLIHTGEPLAALDCFDQSVLQRQIAFVRGQIQSVEAGVRPRIIFRRAPLLDREHLRSVRAVQLLEAVHRNAARSGHELQQSGTHLIGEGQHRSPEPLDDDVVSEVITLVQGVALPVLDVDALDAAH